MLYSYADWHKEYINIVINVLDMVGNLVIQLINLVINALNMLKTKNILVADVWTTKYNDWTTK